MPAIGAISFVESAECQEQFYNGAKLHSGNCDVVIGRDSELAECLCSWGRKLLRFAGFVFLSPTKIPIEIASTTHNPPPTSTSPHYHIQSDN